MSSSGEYIPNAEGNLSNMSDMDKSSDNTEIDLNEINDVLLKNLESDVFSMQNEFKQKDIELQNLLDELQKKFYAEKDLEFAHVQEEYDEKIKTLQEKVDELEDALKNERKQNRNYFSAVETLENENEKLRDENRRLLAETIALNDKLQKINQINKSMANSSVVMNAPASPTRADNNILNRNRQIEKSKHGLTIDFEEEYSTSDFEATGFLKSDNFTNQIDEAWINKFEFIKEKLLNEQNRSKELEFMIVTQKNIIENSNETMTKLKQENKELDTKIEKLRSEIDGLQQSRIKEKTKMDSVITFCELMDNCVFPRAELVEKLSELPIMITSYLKGDSETIAFNKNQNPHSKLILAAKKVKSILEQMDDQSDKSDKNYRVGLVASELDDIRHGLTNLTQFLSKAIPPSTHNSSNEYEPEPEKKNPTYETFKFATQPPPQPDMNFRDQMTNMRTNNHLKSSFFLAKAVQNSNPLLWNYNQSKPKPGMRTSSEGR